MENKELDISVVVPCYNEAENIPLMVKALVECLDGYRSEIILVDDGSTDNSPEVCSEIAIQFPELKTIRFIRNFGHQAALKAGIDVAIGNAIITIDADLQQPPSLIPAMIAKWETGIPIVEGQRVDNGKTSWLKKTTSGWYYRLLGWLTGLDIKQGVSDFRLIDRDVAETLKNMAEPPVYLRGLFTWMGYPIKTLPYTLEARKNGKTKYTLGKMAGLAASGITTISIKPLRLATLLGLIISGGAFLYGLYALYVWLFTDKTVTGWTSTIFSILFLAGIQLLVLGIMGEYIGRLFLESKQRPGYIVKERKGFEEGLSGY